jgi:hypothetical protein
MKYLRFFCDILSKKYIVNYGNWTSLFKDND